MSGSIPGREPVVAGNFVEVQADVRLHYATCGDASKPLMLLLHGFPEYWGAWRDLMPRFADEFFVVAPDLRGYNLSDKPSGVAAYKTPLLVADVLGLIEALGYQSAVVVGHDWGGAIGWAFAIAYPDFVDRLVILNAPHPVPFARALANDADQQAASRYMNWLRAPGSEQLLAADDFRRLELMLSAPPDIAPWFDDAQRDGYRLAWSQPGALESAANWYRASVLAPPIDASDGAWQESPGARKLVLQASDFVVRVPTLVIWGERDVALLPPLLDELPTLVADLRIERLPEASHWLVHEQPERIVDLIRGFVCDGAGDGA